MDGLDLADRAVLLGIGLMLMGMTLGTAPPEHGAPRFSADCHHPWRPAVHRLAGSAYLHLLVVG
jgi:hypothetical protein